MKKMLLMATAALIAGTSAIAEAPDREQGFMPLVLQAAQNPAPAIEPGSEALISLEDTGYIGRTLNVITSQEGNSTVNYGGDNTVISYDPISKTIAFVEMGRISAPNTGAYIGTDFDVWAVNLGQYQSLLEKPEVTRAELNAIMYRDTNYRKVGTETGITPFIMTDPSLMTLNPTGTETNKEDLTYVVLSSAYAVDRTGLEPEIVRVGGVMNIQDPIQGVAFGDEFSELNLGGPTLNNPGGAKTFRSFNLTPYQGNYGGTWTYGGVAASLLDEPEATSSDNNYGFINADVSQLSFETNLPATWSSSQFRSENYQSNFLTVDRVTDDAAEDIIWAGISGWFSDDFNDRKLAMSWSTDGLNFGSWAKFDLTVLENMYVGSRPELSGFSNYEIDLNLFSKPYQKYDFMALSSDEASLFVPITYKPVDVNSDDPWITHLVQVTYNRQTEAWSTQKIADLGPTSRWELRYKTDIEDVPANFPDWYYDTQSSSGNQIDVSRSDAGDILVKYVKVTDTIPLATPLNVFQLNNDGELFVPEDNLLDEVQIDEVFMAFKAAGTDSWLEHQMTYDEDRSHNFTFIPTRFSNRNEIPYLHQAKIDPTRYTNAEFQARMVGLPTSLYTLYFRGFTDARLGIADLDALGSVEEQLLSVDMYLADIYPNPTADVLSVSFSLSERTAAKVYLSNSAGQKVMDIFEGDAVALTTKNDINVTSLPTGAYFLTLEANGQNVTKLVNIKR